MRKVELSKECSSIAMFILHQHHKQIRLILNQVEFYTSGKPEEYIFAVTHSNSILAVKDQNSTSIQKLAMFGFISKKRVLDKFSKTHAHIHQGLTDDFTCGATIKGVVCIKDEMVVFCPDCTIRFIENTSEAIEINPEPVETTSSLMIN
jgi:hypothetical protein